MKNISIGFSRVFIYMGVFLPLNNSALSYYNYDILDVRYWGVAFALAVISDSISHYFIYQVIGVNKR
jgi:hypothetical protein